EIEISADKEATPKTSPFEALACRVSSRRAKAVSAKEAVVPSEDTGPVLPEAKPNEEKSVSVVMASASAGTPMTTRLPERVETPAKTPASSKLRQTGKKIATDRNASDTVVATPGTPSHLPIQLTSNQTIEPADSKSAGGNGPNLSSS